MRFFRITKGLPVGPSKFHQFLFVLLVARFNERCSIAHGPLHFPQFYDRPFDWIGVPLKNGIKPKGITVQTRIVSCIHCSRRLWCDGSQVARSLAADLKVGCTSEMTSIKSIDVTSIVAAVEDPRFARSNRLKSVDLDVFSLSCWSVSSGAHTSFPSLSFGYIGCMREPLTNQSMSLASPPSP